TEAELAEDEEARLDAQKVPAPARPASAEELLETARTLGLATLALPDTYFALARGRRDQELRAAIKHNALVDDLPARWLASAPGHLPEPAELARLYADLPDLRGPFARSRGQHGMLARGLELAESCGWLPPRGRVLFPEVALSDGESAYSRLAALAFQGALARYRPLRIEVVRRLDYELGAIEQLGYAPYFLLVKQIGDWARERGIPCVGRGSAADSLVAYCLALTDADPLRYRLPFERFLNPLRKDRPDIDLDFCWRRRDEVLAHVYEAFGAHRTAMISTLNRFGARAAFRESALALGLPPAEVNQVSRRMPHWIEAGSLSETLRAIPECRSLDLGDERIARALRAADRLLDEPRHYGLHPGGVVVAPGAITDHVSCRRAAKGCVVTELDKDGVEAVGLVKMDLLGNRALTVIADCVELLRARGVEPAIEQVPEHDERTAELLRTGRTLGCSQVESPGMRHLLQQTRAADMDAVIQAIALIRPGPAGSGMKDAYIRRLRELEPVVAPHPRLTELLWDTRGVMLYQEDVMQVALHLAGMDLAEADQLRRALQKKRHGELDALKKRFEQGSAANGVDAPSIAKVWELVSNFSSFGFCKAHAVTYGRIGYRCVYLKAHWPAAYMVAFLKSETGYYDARVYVEEARRLGVRILGPDINRSEHAYALERLDDSGQFESPCGWGLRLGLAQVKGLSEACVTRTLEERARGAFLSLPDFLERVEPAVDEAEALIECGALDAFDRTRPELLWRLHLLRAPQRRASREAGLDPLLLAGCRETPRTREGGALTGGGW
ncbi:MAG: DNA polymerase III subunit alpha, partial [Planctomycetes bacterium]|nr:DNA polymerase III subunit alpha [Planctomycetota bacterium]